MSRVIQNRYEFVVLCEVENGNPNGDPDAGNLPRIDPETGHGIITDVCIKRKIRNYVELAKGDSRRFQIYVKEGAVLNNQHRMAYQALGIDPENIKSARISEAELRAFMCENFYDIRTFGAVMTTKVNCGQVRGPVQLNFARSVDPVVVQEITLTRVAVTTEADAKRKSIEMGRKHVIPYALYKFEGYVSANLARKTGFSEEDLELFWEAILNMYEHDHSASRGRMAVRKLIIFRHENALGKAPAHKLFDLVEVTKNKLDGPARKYSDYTVTIKEDCLPEGVSICVRS